MNAAILNSRFPNINLSRGNTLPNTVRGDAFLILPKGKKCLIWITYCSDKNVAYVLTFNKTNTSIISVDKAMISFSNDLALGEGTILSGVMMSKNNINFFTITDIHFYKGQDMINLNYRDKIGFISHLLKHETKQNALITNTTVLAMPIVCYSYVESIKIARTLSYGVYGVACVLFNMRTNKGIIRHPLITDMTVFVTIKSQSQCDIYNIYTGDSSTSSRIAAIPDYTTSVMMNTIFRKIKENTNLDLLEESDDEEDFENINADKHVDLSKSVIMKCIYVPRFNKWKPLEICPHASISTNKVLLEIEKKYNSSYAK